MPTTTIDVPLARAHFYGFVARAFRYPDEAMMRELAEALPALALAAEALADPPLEETVDRFSQALATLELEDVQREYSKLFTGQKSNPVNEGDYDKAPFSMANRLADIAAFYRAFGLAIAEDAGERVDFVGSEADFLHAVLLKGYHAAQQGWEEPARICREAETEFLQEHFLWWVPRMAEGLSQREGFYGALGTLLREFTRGEGERCAS